MTSRFRQQGLMAIDALVALIVLSVLLTLGIGVAVKQMELNDYRIVADQQRVFADAFGKYLKDNYAAMLANATATSSAQVTTDMLINTGYLPQGFSSTNMFGQSLLGLARQSAPGQLESIVLTVGGQAIPEMGVRSIAEHLGGAGGFVSSTAPTRIQGVRGGWEVATSSFGVAPGAGHTASALFLTDSSGNITNDYLYRNEIPGHPELNEMNTHLGMRENDINEAGAITAKNDITSQEGWFKSLGDAGWYNETYGGGIYQDDEDWVRIWNNKRFSTDGRIRTGEFLEIDSTATKGDVCEKTGLITVSAKGKTLSCQTTLDGQLKWANDSAGSSTLVGGYRLFAEDDGCDANGNGCWTAASCTSWGHTIRTPYWGIGRQHYLCSCPPGSTAAYIGVDYETTVRPVESYQCWVIPDTY